MKQTVINKNIFKTISDKEMDRKDFLKYGGLVLASVVGFRGIINLLSQEELGVSKSEKQTESSSRRFGGGKYGV